VRHLTRAEAEVGMIILAPLLFLNLFAMFAPAPPTVTVSGQVWCRSLVNYDNVVWVIHGDTNTTYDHFCPITGGILANGTQWTELQYTTGVSCC